MQIKKLESGIDIDTSILRDRDLRSYMIYELLICCIFLPPKVDHTYIVQFDEGKSEYTLDMIFTQIILLKSYTIVRVYEHFSMWTNF